MQDRPQVGKPRQGKDRMQRASIGWDGEEDFDGEDGEGFGYEGTLITEEENNSARVVGGFSSFVAGDPTDDGLEAEIVASGLVQPFATLDLYHAAVDAVDARGRNRYDHEPRYRAFVNACLAHSDIL